VKRRTDYSILDYNNLVGQFQQEPDRAAAIIAASFAECFVEKLLRRFMRKLSTTNDLFDGHGPLATFAAMSDVAYAFGILDKSVHKDLTQIRKVRNHFAHHPEVTNFDRSPVNDFCKQLSTAGHAESSRDAFLFAIGMAVGEMHNIILARDQFERESKPS
jgi:DNA-binding MltR family transcriptional regulator